MRIRLNRYNQTFVADIQAFRGIRYDLSHVGSLGEVVAPPYDVIDAELQTELYQRHPANFVRVILNRSEPGDEADDNYRRAGNFVRTWLREGVLVQDAQAAIYVYHQQFQLDGQTVNRRGFIARIRLEPYAEGCIFPHEQTHASPKQDRLKLTRATQCNTSQIFAVYPDDDNAVQEQLEAAIDDRTPLMATDDQGCVHRMWLVHDANNIANVAALMGSKSLYIADGHHRYETALNYRDELAQNSDLAADHPANYVSMCCVSMGDPGLVVLPTHRLWRGLPVMSSEQLVARLQPAFECRAAGRGAELADELWRQLSSDDLQDQLAFYTAADDAWTIAKLTAAGHEQLENEKPEMSRAWRSLGVSILHELVMPHLLGQTSLASPKYVRSVTDVVEGIRHGDPAGRDATGQTGTGNRFELATLVMSASLQHVRQISEHRERMPAKSTFFYPKLLSGLVINPLYK